MPTSLFDSFKINLKSFKLTAFLLLSPFFFYAQSLTGLWTGVLTNDSNSVRKDQSFEIALTEYRGKVYGYSRSEFIVNDSLYYIVKRVKGIINGDSCEVIDDDIISFNFPQKPDKDVKVYSTFYRNKKDSIWYLAGNWKTNKTKKYYSVSGKLEIKEEKDINASKIFPHLEELNLANDVSFYKDRKKETISYIVKTVEPEKKNIDLAIKTETPANIKDPGAASARIESKTEEVKPFPTSSIENTQINTVAQKPGDIIPIAQTIINKQPGQNKTMLLSTIQDSSKNNELKPEVISQTNKQNEVIANVELKNGPGKQTESIKKEEIKTIPPTLNQNIVKTDEPKKHDVIFQANKNDDAIAKVELKNVPEKQTESIKKEEIKTIPPTLNRDIVNAGEPKKQDAFSPAHKNDETIAKVELKNDPEKQAKSIKKEEIKTTPTILNQDIVKTDEPKKQDAISQAHKNDEAIAKVELKNVPEKQTESIKKEETKTSSTTLNQDIIVKADEPKKQEGNSQISRKDIAIVKTEQPKINKAAIATNNKSDIKNITITTTTTTPSPVKQADAESRKNENTLPAVNNQVIAPANHLIEKKIIKNDVVAITTTIEKKDIAEARTAATLIKERKSEFSQIVNFKSDSLELALYDNGEIDGDTVSVLLNGEIIVAKQCLKATAFKKTIYITHGKDEEFTMVLYAENLGKYPPNTGLLVVHDGEDVYNVHFSADFQKNAGVIFRRKQ